jgi:outer membrane protein TolC
MNANLRWTLLLLISVIGVNGQQKFTLEQALSTALKENHGIAIARNQSEQAANLARPGNAGLLPVVGVVAGTNYNNNNTNFEFANGEVIEQDLAESIGANAALQLNYVLFNGLANINTLRQLQELQNVADVNLRLTIENTLINVTANYYEVARLTEIKRVNEEAILISQDRYQRAKLRGDLGSGSRIDLLNAEVSLNADSVNYFRTLTDLENAKRNLMVAISLEPTTNFDVDTTLYFQDGLVLQELQQSALDQNSFIAISRANERASQYEVKAVKGSYLPQITLGGAYNYSAQQNEANFISQSQLDGLGINAGLTWDIFAGNRRQTDVRNAELELASNRENVEDTRKQIIRDLQNAYNTYINSLYVMNKEQRNKETNKLNFQRTEELFNLGQLNGTQFREAQLNLAQSQANYSNARYLAKIAEIQLIRIAGLLLGPEEDL